MENTGNQIIIIGSGLTGLTLAYYLKKAGKNILLIEKNNRPGGVIQTNTENGFTYETGPSTGVLSSEQLVNLFEDLKADCILEPANPSAKKRYIWKNRKWEALPGGHDFGAVTTPLFSLKDKFRVLGEVFRKKGGYPDETVAELVKRRLGKSILDYAVDPFVSGVYAGDPGQLITQYALPKLYALEQNYGGFIRGSIAKHREYIKNPTPKVTKDVFSVEGGLQKLIDALTHNIGSENILTACQNVKLTPAESGFELRFSRYSEEFIMNVPKVISTVGGYTLASLLPFVPSEQMHHLTNTTYASVVQVAAGYKNWNGIPLDAFGGLIPTKEKREILGVLFPSAIFKNRCPEGGALLSVFLGGIKKPEMFDKTDDEIKQIVLEELKITMNVHTEPDLLKIHRYRHAIAQYDIKTGDRLKSIGSIENKFPGLILAGSIRNGIGISDRVKQAVEIAHRIADSKTIIQSE
jgi:oxygen-dependent protoporphyrinogen oxidase